MSTRESRHSKMWISSTLAALQSHHAEVCIRRKQLTQFGSNLFNLEAIYLIWRTVLGQTPCARPCRVSVRKIPLCTLLFQLNSSWLPHVDKLYQPRTGFSTGWYVLLRIILERTPECWACPLTCLEHAPGLQYRSIYKTGSVPFIWEDFFLKSSH